MDGIAVGSLYALIALGYTMVYGILQFINFAHSDVFMLGAWLSYAVACYAGFAPGVEPGHLPGWTLQLTLYIAIAATLLWIYERFLAGSLRQRTRLPFPQTHAGASFGVAAIWALLILVMLKGTYVAHDSLGWPTLSAAGVLLTSMALCGLIG